MLSNVMVGNSGCAVFREGDRVIKRSKSTGYNSRIIGSYEKMKEQQTDIFLVPDVKICNEYLSTLDMEYISGIPMVMAIDTMDNFSAINFANQVVKFIYSNIKEDELEITGELLRSKLDKINHRDAVYIPDFTLNTNCGYCHGDFTLSNMIYSKTGEIYLIDHLDSYIEAPIMDIIKLFQDLDYYWSVRYFGTYRFSSNFYRNMGLIKDRILSFICTGFDGGGLVRFKKYLMYVNYARILPYLESDQDKKEMSLYMATLV